MSEQGEERKTFWFQPLFEADLRMGAATLWVGDHRKGFENMATLRGPKDEFEDLKSFCFGKKTNFEEDAKATRGGVTVYWQVDQPSA